MCLTIGNRHCVSRLSLSTILQAFVLLTSGCISLCDGLEYKWLSVINCSSTNTNLQLTHWSNSVYVCVFYRLAIRSTWASLSLSRCPMRADSPCRIQCLSSSMLKRFFCLPVHQRMRWEVCVCVLMLKLYILYLFYKNTVKTVKLWNIMI